jgi:hypothetical protein
MLFYTILTSIPLTKVAFFVSNKLANRTAKRVKWIKKETARINVIKKDVTRVLVFTVLKEHPWIPKTVYPKNLAMVDNNHPFRLI